jgi:RHS repeat-associated protein
MTSYAWNARGELRSITGPGTLAYFRYDAVGRRIEKTVNAQTTGFRYDGNQSVQELTGAPGALLPSANLLTGPALDEVFSRTELGPLGAGTQSFVTDALGSTLALSGQDGTLQTEYSYEPFGKTTPSEAASSNSVQFTGRENDGTGLYHYRARYYSPELRRFISEDPLGPVGGDANAYAYAWNAPTRYTDPSGLCVPLTPDVLLDLAFIAFDIRELVTAGRKDLAQNLFFLASDILALCAPGVTGVGPTLRHLADEIDDADRIAAHALLKGDRVPGVDPADMGHYVRYVMTSTEGIPIDGRPGAVAWWDDLKGAIVIKTAPDEPGPGSVFVPDEGYAYFVKVITGEVRP